MIFNQKTLKEKGIARYDIHSSPFLFNSCKKNTHFGTCHYYPILFKEHSFNTSEQLYQYLSFKGYPLIQLEILNTTIGLSSKAVGIYRNNCKLPLFWKYRLDIFMYTLILKVEQNKDFRNRLLKTGNKKIIEDVYWNHGDFFGAKYDKDSQMYIGYNFHGRMLMLIREKLNSGVFDEWAQNIKMTVEQEYIDK